MNAQRPDLGRSEAINVDETDRAESSQLTGSALEARLLKRQGRSVPGGLPATDARLGRLPRVGRRVRGLVVPPRQRVRSPRHSAATARQAR